MFVVPGTAVIRRRMGRIEHNTRRDRTKNSDGFEAGVELVTEALFPFILFVIGRCDSVHFCVIGHSKWEPGREIGSEWHGIDAVVEQAAVV